LQMVAVWNRKLTTVERLFNDTQPIPLGSRYHVNQWYLILLRGAAVWQEKARAHLLNAYSESYLSNGLSHTT
ncbi:hypothetical protein ACT3TC_15800, partial [Halomonas sp. AOP27-A1-41]|uniref:hypothetical protein n=1 Tax=Halomonas sp. AOP27-A1-41 TaxID=3457707 RepID=UPI00403440B2